MIFNGSGGLIRVGPFVGLLDSLGFPNVTIRFQEISNSRFSIRKVRGWWILQDPNSVFGGCDGNEFLSLLITFLSFRSQPGSVVTWVI